MNSRSQNRNSKHRHAEYEASNANNCTTFCFLENFKTKFVKHNVVIMGLQAGRRLEPFRVETFRCCNFRNKKTTYKFIVRRCCRLGPETSSLLLK